LVVVEADGSASMQKTNAIGTCASIFRPDGLVSGLKPVSVFTGALANLWSGASSGITVEVMQQCPDRSIKLKITGTAAAPAGYQSLSEQCDLNALVPAVSVDRFAQRGSTKHQTMPSYFNLMPPPPPGSSEIPFGPNHPSVTGKKNAHSTHHRNIFKSRKADHPSKKKSKPHTTQSEHQ